MRALLLAPGAGAGRAHSALVAVDSAVSKVGITVERMDFPYRRAGRKTPDRQPALLASVQEAAISLASRAGVDQPEVALGGRSMGGRICSIALAEGLPAAALVLISYPLHPPGRRESLRDQHFPQIPVPCLFVSGTRDAFASPVELERASAPVGGEVTHRWIDGADHGMRGRDVEVAAAVSGWLLERVASTRG